MAISACLLLLSTTVVVDAWVPQQQLGQASHVSSTATPRFPTSLNALSERQMQFWEDVEEGLDDIEDFYEKQGLDIDRIRQFGKRYVHKVAIHD